MSIDPQDTVLHTQLQRIPVENVCGVDDLRDLIFRFRMGFETGFQSAEDLHCADRIDLRARTMQDLQDREIAARFLRVADDIKPFQLLKLGKDPRFIIHIKRRPELTDEVRDLHAGDLLHDRRHFHWFWHFLSFHSEKGE